MIGKVFIYQMNWHFYIDIEYSPVFFLTFYFGLACKKICFPTRKGVNRTNESTKRIYNCTDAINRSLKHLLRVLFAWKIKSVLKAADLVSPIETLRI